MTAILILISILIWGVFWLRLAGRVYEFDPGGHKFAFATVWVPYRIAYWIIFVLSLAGAFTLDGLRITSIGSVFLVSAIYSLMFNLLTTLWYESYVHAKYTMTGPMRSNYGAWKYGLVLSLGISSALFFILGIVLAFVAISGH